MSQATARVLMVTDVDEAVLVCNPARVRQEIGRLNSEAMQPPLRQAVQPMQQWIAALTTELAAPLQAARALAEQAKRLRLLLLVVDDDEFLRNLLSNVFGTANYDAARPDPDGRASARYRWHRAHAPPRGRRRLRRHPVVMLTGQSEKQVMVDSLGTGAADFVVKPFDREILLKKVARCLGE